LAAIALLLLALATAWLFVTSRIANEGSGALADHWRLFHVIQTALVAGALACVIYAQKLKGRS
jgi:hypothetical protein